MRSKTCALVVLSALTVCPLVGKADLTIVKDGEPVVVVVVADVNQKPVRPRAGIAQDDKSAAKILVEWVEKMSGAKLPIVDQVPAGKPAIYVGKAAVQAGLVLDDIDSPSNEGVRIVADDKRALIAGQNGISTVKAVCRFLEELGCCYFMDIGELGKVYPRTKTVTVKELDITEKPGFLLRTIWGSEWSGATLWKVWNGSGGVEMATGHSWSGYVPNKDAVYSEHPEYFALREGERRKGGWYCTSNPGVRKIFADNVIKAIQRGRKNPSISPDDGVGYCQCPICQGQDDPDSIEPSSGQVNITNRYCDFIDYVGREVAKVYPDSLLGFYCYADYTQAPTSGIKLSPNIVAWIAPIRYCRYHRIGQSGCPTREQLEEMIDGWANSADKIAYRTYNYNLAECVVPFTLWKVWKHDIPLLKEKGCIGMNLESLANWAIYGPHLYLSIRLSYDPSADADAIMDNFFTKFYGSGAGRFIKQYWEEIARAFEQMNCHTGSFYALHLVYTPEFIEKCDRILFKATVAAKNNKKYGERVRIVSEGLKNAKQYIQIRNAMNAGDFIKAKQVYDVLLARTEANDKAGWGNHYTVTYLKRFIGDHVLPGAALSAPPNKVLQRLPDEWKFTLDPEHKGEEKGYHKPRFRDRRWKTVATFSNPLDAQGFPDVKDVMWYRTTFDVPDKHGELLLHFSEVDGDTSVYVNGQKITGMIPKSRRVKKKDDKGKMIMVRETYMEQSDAFPKRRPFSINITDAAKPGKNVLAVRADHSKINELFLGGIVRPVLLIEKGE